MVIRHTVSVVWKLAMGGSVAASQLLIRMIPLALLLTGSFLIVWSAWDVSPTFGKLVLGLFVMLASHNLSVTEGAKSDG